VDQQGENAMSHRLHSDGPASDLMDQVTDLLNLKNDAALSRALKVPPPIISKLRHKYTEFGPLYIIKVHKVTGWPILKIESMLGIENEFA
jgi:hypothetical protein